MSENTKGKLTVGGREDRELIGPYVVATVGNMATAIGYPESERRPHVEQAQANARRIVACWNALSGIETTEIEAGLIADVREALDRLCADAVLTGLDQQAGWDCWFADARAVLSRLGKE